MTEEQAPGTTTAPPPVVHKGRGISLVWVIPIVAILVGAIIAVDSIRNRGIPIVITLPTADWVEAGKTKIRYLAVEAGTVDSIEMGADLKSVELHCTVHRAAEKRLTEGAQFWLVHPRVGAGGISGLGTILSGAYIAMNIGPEGANKQRRFAGLTDPPLRSESESGLTVHLHAKQLYSLGPGSPVYYREVEVGSVDRYELEKDGSGINLSLFFPEEHADLVRADSRFWNAGGIQISGSLANLDVRTESLDSILSGGLAFDSPRGAKAKPADEKSEFWLHEDRADVESAASRYGGLRIFVEGSQQGSVTIGDAVYYREIPVGAVISQELTTDSRHVRLGLNIQNRYATLVRSNSVFWNASGITANLGLHGLEVHTESLASILAGGIAFATPDSPGKRVKAGSVFRMHDEVKDSWLGWSPMIWRGAPGKAPAAAAKEPEHESAIARFFHHDDKSEEESAEAGEPNKDAEQVEAHSEKRHGFFSRLFHHGDDEKDDEKETDEKGEKDVKETADTASSDEADPPKSD